MGLTSQRRASPSLLHAVSCSWSTPIPAGWSHICDNRRPRPPAASTGAVSAGASRAAPGSPEKSLAAGICPWGQSCTAPCSAAAGLAGEQGHTQPPVHPTSRQGAPQWCARHRHPQPSFTGSEGKLFQVWFHKEVKRMSCCGQRLPVPRWPWTTVRGVWQCRPPCRTCSSQAHL